MTLSACGSGTGDSGDPAQTTLQSSTAEEQQLLQAATENYAEGDSTPPSIALANEPLSPAQQSQNYTIQQAIDTTSLTNQSAEQTSSNVSDQTSANPGAIDTQSSYGNLTEEITAPTQNQQTTTESNPLALQAAALPAISTETSLVEQENAEVTQTAIINPNPTSASSLSSAATTPEVEATVYALATQNAQAQSAATEQSQSLAHTNPSPVPQETSVAPETSSTELPTTPFVTEETTQSQPVTPEPVIQEPVTPELSTAAALPALGPLKVFPGAEGFASSSKAGRGGQLCKVTNLNDEGPGSLRHCAEKSEPRMVIFETGGVIEVNTPIRVKSPYLSIYGQTAPGDGIMLRASLDSSHAPLILETHDILIQHLRIRAGTSRNVTCCRDSISIGSSSPGNVYNIVLDHNSFMWGTDEIIDIWFDSHDITLSYNIIGEGLFDSGSNDKGPAGRSMLVGSRGAHSISIHHNFFSHGHQRNPLLKTTGIVDVTNNLIYHWISRGGVQDAKYPGQKVNWIKNKYVAHLGTNDSSKDSQILWGDILITERDNKTELYLEDNIGYHRPSNNMPESSIAHTNWNEPYQESKNYLSNERYPAPPVTEFDVNDLDTTLIDKVGALLPARDATDKRLIGQFTSRTGKLPNCVSADDRPGDDRCLNNVGGWPVLESGTPWNDSDDDGMPDDWELDNGLDPNSDDALLDDNNDGYLNIEHWIHSIGNN